jgi:apolipoprotein N-acyltransferase
MLKTISNYLQTQGNRIQQSLWGLFIVIISGAAHALSYAPYPSGFLWGLSISVFFWLCLYSTTYRQIIKWCFYFYFSFFLAGCHWLFTSLYTYGELNLIIAVLALLAFCGYLSLFYVVAGVVVHWVQNKIARRFGNFYREHDHQPMFLLLFPFFWLLADLGRGYFLSGFPWLSAGYAHIENPILISFAPFIGVYGIGFLAYSLVMSLVLTLTNHHRLTTTTWFLKGWRVLFMLVFPSVGLGLSGWMFLQYQQSGNGNLFTQPAQKTLSVALVQGNIDQSIKFDPAYFMDSYQKYFSLMKPLEPDLLVLPETVIPVLWDDMPKRLKEQLKSKANGNTHLIMGVIWQNQPDTLDYSNSVLTIFPKEQENLSTDPFTEKLYRKTHLVPFGEVIPTGFHWFVNMMSIPFGEYTAGSRDQPPVSIQGVDVWENICYEFLFGEELAERFRYNQSNQPSILLNLSNFGWFGNSAALWQSRFILQMRTKELEIPVLSSTNTGSTVSYQNTQEVLRSIPHAQQGVLKVTTNGYFGRTLYTIMGNACLFFFLLPLFLSFVLTNIKLKSKNR